MLISSLLSFITYIIINNYKKINYFKSLFLKNRIDRMADIEKVTRLMITLKIAIVVVEIVSKKLNLTAFSGLNRKANKTGDAIIIMTNTNFVFSYPNLYKAGK